MFYKTQLIQRFVSSNTRTISFQKVNQVVVFRCPFNIYLISCDQYSNGLNISNMHKYEKLPTGMLQKLQFFDVQSVKVWILTFFSILNLIVLQSYVFPNVCTFASKR